MKRYYYELPVEVEISTKGNEPVVISQVHNAYIEPMIFLPMDDTEMKLKEGRTAEIVVWYDEGCENEITVPLADLLLESMDKSYYERQVLADILEGVAIELRKEKAGEEE